MHNPDQVTAVILAGGMARRMGGVDKGWMELNGKPLIKHVLDVVQPQVARCMINANRSMDAYGTLGLPVISDLEGDFQGPLMGIATGLHHAATDWVLFAPCDGPFLPPVLVRRMLLQAREQKAEIAVATDGKRMQPVVALIHRDLLGSVQKALASGERKIDRWYAQHNYTEVDFSDFPEAFTNVNRRDDLDDLQQMPKLLGFAAWSGTGKTTLLKKLIPALKEDGIRVGVIKHAHHKFDVDHPGKDSYELRKAGADQMLISSGKRWALMVEQDQGDRPSLNHMLSRMDHSLLDLVLVEGFKQESFPKIELHRKEINKGLMYLEDENIIAVASDEPLQLHRELPLFNINDTDEILRFIKEYIS
ncbi:molybdenum cofactor guanylyltransferase MobA [Neptuniibacter sp. PT8_73]|uniref:molybdenum cofactor guanylyltransferase MobA n=1 Tax=unclassified Neptuniibacter TaxID=2630693 RepID=UPI0039F5DF67